MGLLDNLLMGASADYGGQNAGLLDLLRRSQMQQDQYQPSSGFPPAGPAPAPFASRFDASAPGASFADRFGLAVPMQIGGYQMPRIGDPSQFTPDPSQAAAIPQNAQPTQGQLPPQAAPQAPQEFPPALGGGGYFSRLKNGGSLIGSLISDSPQQQNLRAQYDATHSALLSSGKTPQEASSLAMLAVMNPEAAKTLLPEALTNKTELKMVKDAFGAEHPYSWNPREQTLRPVGPSGESTSSSGGGVQQMTDKIATMGQSGATRQQMLKEVPSDFRGHVEAVLEGRALPTNIGRGPARAAIMAAAHAIDPTFDESNIPLRFKTAGDYAPNGQSGRSIVALNTVQHHIGQLSDALENKDLGDTGWTFLNKIRNGVAQNTPLDQKQGAAIKQVEDAMTAVEDEMANAYKAGRVSDKEIQRWHELTDPNKPLWQQKQGIKDFVGLLNGKRDQLNETHQAILGREAPGINKELNAAITERVNSRSDALNAKTNGAAKPATVIQNGHTYTLQSDGSYK